MRLRRIILTSFALGLSLVALNVGSPASVSAESENNDSYVYVAKAGDSYTELARSSIIKFDEANDKVELNTAEVTAAETWLTQDAGSPAIQVGQEVKVSKANTEKFAKQADELSDEAKNLWQGYADKSSISNTDLKDQTREEGTAPVEAPAETPQTEQSTETPKDTEQSKVEDDKKNSENTEKKSSKKWLILAIVVLLILAAVSLIRSSSSDKEDE